MQGAPVLFLHGFPGWWAMWRPLMTALLPSHTVIAMDMRAFNLSDKPRNKSDYGVGPLLGDIRAVLAHAGFDQATLVGHDFGGAFAFTLAVGAPEVVTKLVVLNGLHPWSLQRALHEDPRQRKAAKYAQELRRPDALRRPIPERSHHRSSARCLWCSDATTRSCSPAHSRTFRAWSLVL
jgi:pimeloyl-ACP methyl ester carboxylesterase